MTSGTPRLPARRTAAAVAASAVILALASAAGCSSGQRAATRPSPAPATTAPSCEAAVLALLARSAADAQDGYDGGLSPETVMNHYGYQSAVFQAWEQLDGQVLAAQAQDGPDGLLAPFIPQVARLCAQYGGQPQQGSPAS
ncbi:MAG: hypothetical protein ACRDRJ_15135 [Streptosporangiaceae bacterium]